jgi:hypothetical protein
VKRTTHATKNRQISSLNLRRNEPKLNAEVSAEIGGVPPVSQALRLPPDDSISVRTGLPMNTHSPDFVTVDMRGLKAALVARAQAQRVSVSVLVRAAVARNLGVADGEGAHQTTASANTSSSIGVVKMSIRMTAEEAGQLADGARSAGLSRGAYLAGLIAAVPVLTCGTSRPDHIATLTASNAELSTLSRNIHHLTSLLRQGAVRPAQEYRAMLDTLAGDVRVHLKLASVVLSDLQPQRRHRADAAKRPTT